MDSKTIQQFQKSDDTLSPLYIYQSEGHLPKDSKLADKILKYTSEYTLHNGLLYYKGYTASGRDKMQVAVPQKRKYKKYTNISTKMPSEVDIWMLDVHSPKFNEGYFWVGLYTDVKKMG